MIDTVSGRDTVPTAASGPVSAAIASFEPAAGSGSLASSTAGPDAIAAALLGSEDDQATVQAPQPLLSGGIELWLLQMLVHGLMNFIR